MNDFELDSMRQQMETLKDSERPHHPSVDEEDGQQHQHSLLLHHGTWYFDGALYVFRFL